MTELDKFKRRTIRSVARLLRQKKPPDELWSEMKKETGTDCRVLWERMRALCIKKLNRMLAVDDRSDSLPSIARLSLTDWLLVDLVLVHEKIDVIAMDKVDNKAEQKPLIQLFNLVQRFDVEGRSGEELAEAWAAATVFYNRQGRQCSPMLLQRRWYQLKKLTRCRFYKFWQSYRGNTRLLAEARQAMPTRLQMAVAKRYPAVITGPFPEWEELIPQRLIILPEEFESKMRMTTLPKPCNSNDPDLVVVEPVIETIELAGDSDTEEPKGDQNEDTSDPEKSNDATAEMHPPVEDQTTQSAEVFGVKVKTEPIEEDGLSNVQVVATTHVPEVEISDESPELDDEYLSPALNNRTHAEEMVTANHPEYDVDVMCDEGPELNKESFSKAEENKINTEEKASKNSSESEDDVIEIPNVIPSVHIDLESPTKVSSEEMIPTISRVSSDVISKNVNDDVVEDIIKLKADEFCRKDKEVPPTSNVSLLVDDLIKHKVETFLKTPKDKITFNEKKPNINVINSRTETLDLTAVDLMADLNFVDDGIEFIDDGVEFVEENYEPKGELVTKASSGRENNEESEDTNKFDLKLLMDPVVYTTKLDHMTMFLNTPFGSVDNKEHIDKIIMESRPVSKKSFNINIKQEDTISQNDNTSAIDDTGVNDDLFTNQESDDEDMEDITVSEKSYMLRKPRTRTYNPIQLCKNPDFNTKLRRLAIGFFSSSRNRQLLNACIPMTIDVSKAFESKLINGTLYLKSSGTNLNVAKESEIDNQASTSVVPTALPMQSLLDNSRTNNILDLIPTLRTDLIPTTPINLVSTSPTDFTSSPHTPLANSDPVISERKKIISLPDIDKVRKINQQLLTAQVPPIRVYAGDSYRPPVQSVPAVVTNQEKQIKPTETDFELLPAETVPAAPLPPEPSSLPTVVKVESEATLDNKDITASETIIPPEPVPPAKQKLLKIINQAKLLTQEALTKIDMGAKTSVSDGLKQLTLVRKPTVKLNNDNVYKKNAYNRIPVPWKPRWKQRTENIDDFLITDDTLNKMLHLMSGEDSEKGCACCSQKQKKAEAKKASRIKHKKQAQTIKDSTKNDQKTNTENQANVNPDQDDKGNTKPPENTGQKTKPVLARGRFVRYCCWARQKLCHRKRITKHTCQPDECICCCRDELAKSLKEKKWAPKPIEVSDDEEKSLKMACESIENVVQQSWVSAPETFIPQEKTPPKLVVMRTISTSTDSSNLESISGESLNQAADVNVPEPPKAPPVITKLLPAADLHSMFRKRNPAPKPKEPLCVPCPCQGPAITQGSQLSIVIDASRTVTLDSSKKCNLHTPPPPPAASKETKILYLHSKSLSKSPSESPIFLGKNKILLTTVKFPQKEEVALPECEVFQAPRIIPTLPLPNGVQLVLLPSGSVTYTLDQGVELTADQLATLPTIIAAVQEQLNTSSVPPLAAMNTDSNPSISRDDQPVIDLSQSDVIANTQTADLPATDNVNANEVLENKELPQMIKETVDIDKMASTNTDTTAAPTNTKEIEVSKATESGSNSITDKTVNNVIGEAQKITLASNDSVAIPGAEQSLAESEPPTEKQNQDTETAVPNSEGVEVSNDNDAANNRKSLLSDLMEMSGISAEDATAADPPATTQPAPVFVNPEQARNLPELSPVTSFAELKYACEHNGKFFKLDFETGVIVPINVCIKKNPKQKAPAQPKAIIDLTDDMDDSNDSTNTQESEPEPAPEVIKTALDTNNSFFKTFQQYIYRGKTLNVQSTVKPIKLFKAVRPPSLLKRQNKLVVDMEPLVKRRTHLQNRKQMLNKVEAKIDLVDSDAPMEEEYLMDSSDDDGSKTENEPMLIEALDELDFSSDDEPLAKKSKRMKEAHETTDKDNLLETNNHTINEVETGKTDPEPKPNESVSDVTKDLAVPMETDDTPSNENNEALNADVAQPVLEPAKEPQLEPQIETEKEPDTELEPELEPELDPELEPELDPELEPELRFMSDVSDNEDGEDCILGV